MKKEKTVKSMMGICLLFLALAFFPVKAEAAVVDSGRCGNTEVYWELDDAGKLRIYGQGALPNNYHTFNGSSDFIYYTKSPWCEDGRIKTVVIEEGVTDLCNYTFWGCNNLTSVTMAGSVKTMGQYTFAYCKSLKEISFSEGFISMWKGTFKGCSSLESVKLPKRIEKIYEETFADCPKLADLYIPAACTEMDNIGAEKLKNYFVDPENKIWKSIDGVLFNKSGTRLEKYPPGRSNDTYTVPSGTVIIGEYAFENANVSEVTLPETVTMIQSCAFKASKLSAIHLPLSLTQIGSCAFVFCPNLSSITIPPSVVTIGLNAYGDRDDCVIYGVTGSVAYIYAMDSGVAFVPDPCAGGHSWDGGVVSVAATKKAPGKKLYTCTACGKTKEEMIPAAGSAGTGLIMVKATAVKKLTRVPGRKIRVTLKKVSGAAGYQVAWSVNKKFRKSVYKMASRKNTCIIRKKLKKNKTYYVRGRAYKRNAYGKKVYGTWSRSKKIKVR